MARSAKKSQSGRVAKKAVKQVGRQAAKKAARRVRKKTTHKTAKSASKKSVKKSLAKSTGRSANRTQPEPHLSVDAFLRGLNDPQKESDSRQLIALLRRQTGHEPRIWGTSMIGFGSYHYRYASGRQGDMFLAGFAPRAANLVIYVMAGFARNSEIMERLGKYKRGKSCLYLRRLADVDAGALAELSQASIDYMRANYECT